jgi:hypothetical protein
MWANSDLKVYNGTFVNKPLKRWNGSAWKEINTTV